MRTSLLATLAMTVVVIIMAGSQGGPGYFIQLGDKSRALEFAKDKLGDDVPTPLADGHDGESYWLLSRDPTLSAGPELAQLLNRPTYRAQRILYPALASPWRLGGEHALLWGLVITNLAVVAVGTYLTGAIARRVGAPLAGYLFAANPVVWLALLFDFADGLALAGLIGAVLALRRGHPGLAGAAGVVAALAKESSLFGIAGMALLGRGLSLRQRVLVAVPAGSAALLWRLYVVSRPGFSADAEIEEFALAPFSGFQEAWRLGWSPSGEWVHAAMSLALIPAAVGIVAAWWRWRGSWELSAALPFALLVPFLSGQVLDIPVNSARAIGPALTLAAVGVLLARRPAPAT